MNISDGDPFYQSVIQHLQTILGSAWATYFVPKPADYAGDTQLVDLEEAMNYIDLLKFSKKCQQGPLEKVNFVSVQQCIAIL